MEFKIFSFMHRMREWKLSTILGVRQSTYTFRGDFLHKVRRRSPQNFHDQVQLVYI